MLIRSAHMEDAPSIWRIIAPKIRAGETYALDPDMTEADALAYWLDNDRETFVGEEDGEIVSTTTFVLPGGWWQAHLQPRERENASATGRGVGRDMC